MTGLDMRRSELGMIPPDWEVKRLLDVCEFSSGKAHEQFIEETAPFVCVNSKFISTDGRVRKFSTKNFLPARVNDILLVMSDLPNGRALAKTFLVEEDNLYAVNQRVCRLRPVKDSSVFLSFLLNRNPYFLKFDDGVNQTHLLNRVFEKCVIAMPPTFAEQESIGKVLSDITDSITSLDSLIAKKRDIKQGTMQQLLTGKTRLPGFSGEWEHKSLSNLGICIRGVTYNPERDLRETDSSDTSRLLRSNNVAAGRINTGAIQFVCSSRVSDLQVLRKGDVVICMANGSRALVGKAAIYDPPSSTHHYTFGAFMGAFRCNDFEDSSFVSYLFQSNKYRNFLDVALSGSSINNLNPGQILEMVFTIPEAAEKRAIAEVLTDMDAEIDVLVARREKTALIKTGMMQELLTGRTRLI